MASRTEQLAQKRRDLQMQCALQRQQLSFLAADIETRLATADRVIDVASAVARNPAVLIGAIAGAMILGPWRILKVIGNGAMLFKAFNVAKQLLGR